MAYMQYNLHCLTEADRTTAIEFIIHYRLNKRFIKDGRDDKQSLVFIESAAIQGISLP